MDKKIHIPKSPARKSSWRLNPQLSNVPCHLQNVLHTHDRFWIIPIKNPQNPKFWCKIYEAFPIRRKNNNPVHITQTSERWCSTPYSSTGKFRCDQLTTNTTPQPNEEKKTTEPNHLLKLTCPFLNKLTKAHPDFPKQSCRDRLETSEKRFWKEV